MQPFRSGRAFLAALLLLAGCAAPGPRGPAPEAPGEVVETPAEIEPLPRLPDDVDAAVALLRGRIADATGTEALPLRARLASVLESAGRTDAALLEFVELTGAAPPAESAAAWDGVARIRRTSGDEAGALEAETEALRVAPDGQRSDREARLTRAVRGADAGTLRTLERRTGAAGGGDILARELAGRSTEGPVVALLLPMTGRFESFGRAFQIGAELALADRRARGEDGAGVRLVVIDTGGDLAQGTRAARQAILEDGAVALIGPLLSVPALAAGAVADAFGIPLIAPTATDPAIRRIGPHVLSLDPPARELTEPLVRIAAEELQARRFAALVPREPAAEERERQFRAAVARAGGEWVLSVAFDPGERDFRKLLEMLEDAHPDVVYVPAEAADLEALVPQMEFYEFAPRVAGHGGWTSPRVLQPGLAFLEGALLSVEGLEDPSTDISQHLREEVERVENADPTRFHMQGYRALAAVLFALDRGATRPAALGEALRLRASWPARPEGERIRLLTVREGELVPPTPDNLAARPEPPAEASPDQPGVD